MTGLSLKPVLVFLVFSALVALAVFLSWAIVKTLAYEPQTVRIDRVEVLCSQRPSGRRVRWLDPVRQWTTDCRQLIDQFGNGKVEKQISLSFIYISPADGARYEGILQRDWNDRDQGARVGDLITIEASSLRPRVFTDWSSPSIASENVTRR